VLHVFTSTTGDNPQRNPDMTKLNTMIVLRIAAMLDDLSPRNLMKRDEGQTLAEYAMILGLIAVVVVAVVALLGTTISSLFSNVRQQI
jgi:pilus assembly protein Flp/PilA